MDPTAQFEDLRKKLKLRQINAKIKLSGEHPQAAAFFQEKGLDLGKVRQHAGKLLAAGTLGGALLLAPPKAAAQTPPLPQVLVEALAEVSPIIGDTKEWLAQKLRDILPPSHTALGLSYLSPDEEKAIGKLIERVTGIKAAASLEGEHLNTSFGVIGAEQHLPRFPGDTIGLHDDFPEVGITASRGAFGWFTEGKFDDAAKMREKYYVAVQTLYLPDWDRRWNHLKDWYKWRKVIVVNPENGSAVVAVVGDAGPAAWTGKHFGGSPEVMNALGGQKYKKGPVLMFFVDDPQNLVPLGPVDYGLESLPVVKST